MSTILSACYLLSLLLVQTVASTLMGQITLYTGRMKPQIVFGFTMWFVGQGLVSTFGSGEERARIVGFLVLAGVGVGATLQTSEFLLLSSFFALFAVCGYGRSLEFEVLSIAETAPQFPGRRYTPLAVWGYRP